jgi:flagellar assembly protein FliH
LSFRAVAGRMSLSRVFRLNETANFKALRLVDFDEQGQQPGKDGPGSFVEEDLSVRAAVVEVVRSVSGAPAVDQSAQLAEARRQGRQEALAEAGGNLTAAADALGQALQDISRLRADLLRSSTGDMVRLVMAIAEQVIGAEIATRPEFILETLKDALHHCLKADEVQVRIHPDDLSVVTENRPLFLAAVSGLKNIVFEAGPSVARGGCLVESHLGQVDASIESRLEDIRRRLDEHLGGG